MIEEQFDLINAIGVLFADFENSRYCYGKNTNLRVIKIVAALVNHSGKRRKQRMSNLIEIGVS